MTSTTEQRVRPLTNDEKKAAEAAFRGAPFHPTWSESARKIYQGISAAMVHRSETSANLLPKIATPSLGQRQETNAPSRTRLKSKSR